MKRLEYVRKQTSTQQICAERVVAWSIQRRAVRAKVPKPAMATKMGVLMTRVKLTASNSALVLMAPSYEH